MFEKDIYQLIRGLRAHKGNEREYIQDSLRECRKEIKGQDMDAKATALLKLVYLEMFGHDMSWASFHVLEVMSAPRALQKRVGYLAAVQSFRSDTEVLMLAENLLKKDLNSPDRITLALPLVAIPHVVNPSMANSLLTDLLPRLSHSSPAVRKKTIVTLYRLALVYPETLRPAWPRIRERLLDEHEDPSVTAAIVNVICELGWRRPQDFLPLAPRLFELLIVGANNWMAIKIIKLFSVLTPLEPRLVKKLLPPLTSLIKTTPAMSLLYECINGIIQGGIMEAAEGTTEGDEIARLCVNKLRAMLVVEGDPNLRYVALLAFAKITSSHADLVAQHQDVILECIDDADISIRTRALDLVVGMINANNLQNVVERLLRQLRSARRSSAEDDPANDRAMHDGIVPMADDNEDDAEQTIRPRARKPPQAPPLPDDYRSNVIEKILDMCSRDTYANMNDFDWYIGVLVELVKQCPSTSLPGQPGPTSGAFGNKNSSVSDSVGSELLNVAVRVKAVRPEAAAAAQSLLLVDRRPQLFPAGQVGAQGVLAAAAFIAGEYSDLLPDPEAVLTSLLHSTSSSLPTNALSNYLQAIPKIFSALTSNQQISWTSTKQSTTTLFIARIIHFLEPLTLHPNLEIQERAVEYLDLMRLANEAVASQPIETEDVRYAEPPLILTQAIPALFVGTELNPVAATALDQVPQPEGLDLDIPINSNLQMLLQQAEYDTAYEGTNEEVFRFYHEKPSAFVTKVQRPAVELLDPPDSGGRTTSYQDADEESLDPDTIERKKAERRERYRDDPYYIDSDRNSGTSTPVHHILRASNGTELDVDTIPVMELKLDSRDTATRPAPSHPPAIRRPRKHFEIAADETLGSPSETPSFSSSSNPRSAFARTGAKKSLLEVDSSGLSTLSLSHDTAHGSGSSTSAQTARRLDFERRQAEEAEMAAAMREVERLRLEMQRAQERVAVRAGLPEEGTVVKSKVRRKKAKTAKTKKNATATAATTTQTETEDGQGNEENLRDVDPEKEGGAEEDLGADLGAEGAATLAKKKKKKKKVKKSKTREVGEEEREMAEDEDEVVKPKAKKKKKKRMVVLEDHPETSEGHVG